MWRHSSDTVDPTRMSIFRLGSSTTSVRLGLRAAVSQWIYGAAFAAGPRNVFGDSNGRTMTLNAFNDMLVRSAITPIDPGIQGSRDS